jgi:RNA polymerase sigma-70 factor (ECF subfamily)
MTTDTTTDQLSFCIKPNDPVSILDSAKAVRDAFSELTPNQKRVLVTAYFEGFSQSEIAAKLQEPLGPVKSWMRSAMERLRIVVKAGVTK